MTGWVGHSAAISPSPHLTAERAGERALSCVRSFRPSLKGVLEEERGAPIDINTLRADRRNLYAATPHVAFPPASNRDRVRGVLPGTAHVAAEDEADPCQAISQPGSHWAEEGSPQRYPREYVRGGTAKLLCLFHRSTGEVRVQGVLRVTNAVLHRWMWLEAVARARKRDPSHPSGAARRRARPERARQRCHRVGGSAACTRRPLGRRCGRMAIYELTDPLAPGECAASCDWSH